VLPKGADPFEPLFDGTNERFCFKLALPRIGLLERRQAGLEGWFGSGEIVDPCPGQSLDKDANGPVGQLQHAHDERNAPGLIQLFG
jgi:hypothetical protein